MLSKGLPPKTFFYSQLISLHMHPVFQDWKNAMTTEFNEIYLSDVLGKTVINSKGEKLGTLRDLVMIPGDVFPEVSHIVIKARKGLRIPPLE